MKSRTAIALALCAAPLMAARAINRPDNIVSTEEPEEIKTVSIPTLAPDPIAAKLADLTPAQKMIYASLHAAGKTREEAYTAASAVDPEITVEELQAVAQARLAEQSPAYRAALEKRQRKAAKLQALAERAGA